MRKLTDFLSNNGSLVVLTILFVGASLADSAFLSRLNLSAIAFQYSIIGMIALGQFVVILTGGIDLSQGSLVAIGSISVAVMAQIVSLPMAILVALLVCAFLGAVNGGLASFTRIPPFVITLGMLGVARGLALTLTNSRPVPVSVDMFLDFGRARLGDVPVVFLIFLVVAVLLGAILTWCPIGRHIYAVGGSEENSRLSGVNVVAVKMFSYTLSGLVAGASGLMITARMGTGHPLSGTNYELESIAAVVIGGASLFGGIGRITGIVAGVLTLGIVHSIINLSGIPPYLQGTLKGTVILLAVALSQLQLGRKGGAPLPKSPTIINKGTA